MVRLLALCSTLLLSTLRRTAQDPLVDRRGRGLHVARRSATYSDVLVVGSQRAPVVAFGDGDGGDGGSGGGSGDGGAGDGAGAGAAGTGNAGDDAARNLAALHRFGEDTKRAATAEAQAALEQQAKDAGFDSYAAMLDAAKVAKKASDDAKSDEQKRIDDAETARKKAENDAATAVTAARTSMIEAALVRAGAPDDDDKLSDLVALVKVDKADKTEIAAAVEALKERWPAFFEDADDDDGDAPSGVPRGKPPRGKDKLTGIEAGRELARKQRGDGKQSDPFADHGLRVVGQ